MRDGRERHPPLDSGSMSEQDDKPVPNQPPNSSSEARLPLESPEGLKGTHAQAPAQGASYLIGWEAG